MINDGEQRKSGFTTYLKERLAGFEAVPYAAGRVARPRGPKWPSSPSTTSATSRPPCTGPCSARPPGWCAGDRSRTSARKRSRPTSPTCGRRSPGKEYTEVFLSAALPTGLAEHEQRVLLRPRGVRGRAGRRVPRGVPGDHRRRLPDPARRPGRLEPVGPPDAEPAERDRRIAEIVELINYSLRDIPPEKIRYHTCYGINQGPHIYDLRLRDFIEPMLTDQRPGDLVRGDEHHGTCTTTTPSRTSSCPRAR